MLVICRYGEIFLKGNNRSFFERALAQSIRERVGSVTLLRNRILVETDSPAKLRTVFGLISYSPAAPVAVNPEAISSMALTLLAGKTFKSFRIKTQRLTKEGHSSAEFNTIVGAAVQEATGARVDLENADIIVGVEIIENNAYVFTERISCPGGLPYGVSGTVTVWVDDPYAELAGLLMLKRGCAVVGAGTRTLPVLQRYDPKFRITQDTLYNGPVVRGLLSEGFNSPDSLSLYPLIGMTADDAEQRLNDYACVY